MHNKKNYNSKRQNFIQGLRPFSNSIPQGLKKVLKKSGYNFTNIVDNWTKIVGKDISGSCYPLKVKISKELNNGILLLCVIHGKELEIEYNKGFIIDKINLFFGYNYISEIKLKIIQKEMNVKKNISIKNNLKNKFEDSLNKVNNTELKTSLNKLIRAYRKKND